MFHLISPVCENSLGNGGIFVSNAKARLRGDYTGHWTVVKEKVMARLDVEPELSDVVEVCQAWEDGLVVL